MNAAPHILLVDDEPRFAESLQQILLVNNYPCTIASNGAEALELLRKKIFALILLDIDLPDLNGLQMISFIKESISTTPIIMMTGNATVETAIEAMKKGAYDYLKKPIVHDLLTSTIKKAINHYKLETELKDSETRFKTLSEASWEGVLFHDRGLIIEANEQFFDIFGYQKDDLVNTNILEKIFDKESLEHVMTRIQEGIIGSHEAVGVRKDGSRFPLETRSNFIELQGQQVRVCAIRDITERKAAEQENLKLQMQLAKASKMEALGLMAGSVAHDLNNILAGIVSFPDVLLLEMDESSKHWESIKGIQEAGKRAALVVSDLITIARGATTPKVAKNPNTIISDHLLSLEHKDYISKFPGISVTTNLDAKLANIYCTEMHIKKVLMNLLGNALEALDNQGLIHISTKNVQLLEPVMAYEVIPAGDYVKIAISDNGSGIAPKDLEQIFEPFYSKKVMGRSGTGLGLAIVWSRTHDHDGFINLLSGNQGTTFELYIPSTNEVEFQNSPAISLDALKGNGEAILVVDDQEAQCSVTCNLLTKLGYQASKVTNGEDAIEICRRTPVDLLLLDMILEDGINGRQTYEQILKDNPHQKAIVVSGFSENEEMKNIQKLGVSHFVKKPYTFDQLGIAVKQSLGNFPNRF